MLWKHQYLFCFTPSRVQAEYSILKPISYIDTAYKKQWGCHHCKKSPNKNLNLEWPFFHDFSIIWERLVKTSHIRHRIRQTHGNKSADLQTEIQIILLLAMFHSFTGNISMCNEKGISYDKSVQTERTFVIPTLEKLHSPRTDFAVNCTCLLKSVLKFRLHEDSMAWYPCHIVKENKRSAIYKKIHYNINNPKSTDVTWVEGRQHFLLTFKLRVLLLERCSDRLREEVLSLQNLPL